jgi:hypothetical protein
MKAIVIYDDPAIATKAITALQRATHHQNATVKWNLRPWRIDMLKLPPTADHALIDGADAVALITPGASTSESRRYEQSASRCGGVWGSWDGVALDVERHSVCRTRVESTCLNPRFGQ